MNKPLDSILTTNDVANQTGIHPRTIRLRAQAERLGRNTGSSHRAVWLFTPADVRRLQGERVPETEADRALQDALTTDDLRRLLSGDGKLVSHAWVYELARKRGLGVLIGGRRGAWLFTPEEAAQMQEPGQAGWPGHKRNRRK